MPTSAKFIFLVPNLVPKSRNLDDPVSKLSDHFYVLIALDRLHMYKKIYKIWLVVKKISFNDSIKASDNTCAFFYFGTKMAILALLGTNLALNVFFVLI